MANSKAVQKVISSKMLAETFSEMLKSVPANDEVDAASATESFLAKVLASESLDDLDAAWNGGGDLPLNVEVEISRIAQLPSDFEQSLGVFLLVWYKETVSEKEAVATTGSLSVVAQLVKACSLDAFPFKAVLRESPRASRAGFYPQHLDIVRR